MLSGKKPMSCVPCAKRKVRCDKRQPCCHCKRRKDDICVYPSQRAIASDGRPNDLPPRIEKLEAYIRRLGGDPQLAEQAVENNDGNMGNADSQSLPTRLHGEGFAAPTTRQNGRVSPAKGKQSWLGEQAGLVEHDEQVTYIETPMWYSWSGAKTPDTQRQRSHAQRPDRTKSNAQKQHFFPALLDPAAVPDSNFAKSVFPPAAELTTLWKTYLSNVHPLLMIFFDWDIEFIVHKALKGPDVLGRGEQTLILAICFVATLSLSEEECFQLLHVKRAETLTRFQEAVESSLVIAEFIVTSDRLILQAFMLYLQVMRSRARPAAVFSLLGIASRIAERMGLHRDGDDLGVSVLRSEERRRIWWQLQHMDIMIAQLVGNVTMMIYAGWDAKFPRNLEDRDLRPDTQTLPPDRRGLTTMSHCLWRYQILNLQRNAKQPDGTNRGLAWMTSPQVPLSERDAMLDVLEKTLGEQFLQYCEPLNPLHLHIQIGVRGFVLAARRVVRQPSLINARISEMSLAEREDFLGICTKSLEYYVLSMKTDTLKGYRWHNETYFQWAAFVYIILEAHHRYNEDVVRDLWSLIERVYLHHPKLRTAVNHPDIISIVNITLIAWEKYHSHAQQHLNGNPQSQSESPAWITELRRKFDMQDTKPMPTSSLTGVEPESDAGLLFPQDFDFDLIDWSFCEDQHLDATLQGSNW